MINGAIAVMTPTEENTGPVGKVLLPALAAQLMKRVMHTASNGRAKPCLCRNVIPLRQELMAFGDVEYLCNEDDGTYPPP